jgi:hypothetical protein
MTDKPKTTKPDRERINLLKEDEVRDWCGFLGCTPSRLQAAVKAVGPLALDVEAYLKGRPRSSP